jgi:regulator of cell morphogenesis and NO signaling
MVSTIESHRTLGDLVIERPYLAEVFDRLGIDYCCAGARSLRDACAEAGLDVDELQLPVEPPHGAAAGTHDWTALDLAALTVHIETTHHASLHRELPRLAALADKVATVHGDRHPELAAVRDTLAELHSDLDPHLEREEEVVFPMIRALSRSEPRGSSVQTPIALLLTEHDRAGELLRTLRRQTGGYSTPPDGCASYRAFYDGLAELEADLHLHVHKENNRLFPAAIEVEARMVERVDS